VKPIGRNDDREVLGLEVSTPLLAVPPLSLDPHPTVTPAVALGVKVSVRCCYPVPREQGLFAVSYQKLEV